MAGTLTGWKRKNWGTIATLEYGKGLRGYQNSDGQYPVFGTNGQIGWHSECLYPSGGVIVGRKGAYRGIHYSDSPFFVIDTAFYLKPIVDGSFSTKWAYYQLLDFDINKMDSGSAIPSTSRDAFYAIQLNVPPIVTQHKIAAILSAYDDLIENNLRRIKILEEMAQNLYREWFVKFRFPGHQHAHFIDSSLGRIPEGWEVNRILEFGNVITGKTPSKANPDFYGADVPFVKTPDMHGNTFILDVGERLSIVGSKSQANKTIPAGSICVSCIGTIGVVSITTEDCQTNQQINTVVLMNEQFREFLFFRLKDAKKALENLGANGATMGNVNKGKFGSLEVVTPSNDLMDRYHECASPLFSKMLVLSRKNRNLRRTRHLLLPKLISGAVDVSELDITIPEEAAA